MSLQASLTSAEVHELNTGINNRQKLADILTGNVADTLLLMVKTQGVHWNVVGPLFVPLHELTEQQYRDLFEAADQIAERIRALGYFAPHQLDEMRSASVIKDAAYRLSAEEMISMLASDHEAIAARMRDGVETAESLSDTVTADLLTARIEVHEKAIWMLRAMLLG